MLSRILLAAWLLFFGLFMAEYIVVTWRTLGFVTLATGILILIDSFVGR